MADSDNQPDKKRVGRPLQYKSVEELQTAIDSYFALCDPHIEERLVEGGLDQQGQTIWVKRKVMTEQKPYLMSGLARALGMSRQALLDYSEREQFVDSVAAAKARCEEYTESQLYGPHASGARFSLANNFNGKYQPWSERSIVAGDPDAPPVALVNFIGQKKPGGSEKE